MDVFSFSFSSSSVMLKVVRDLVGADKIILGVRLVTFRLSSFALTTSQRAQTDYPFPLGDVHPFFKPGADDDGRTDGRRRSAARALALHRPFD